MGSGIQRSFHSQDITNQQCYKTVAELLSCDERAIHGTRAALASIDPANLAIKEYQSSQKSDRIYHCLPLAIIQTDAFMFRSLDTICDSDKFAVYHRNLRVKWDKKAPRQVFSPQIQGHRGTRQPKISICWMLGKARPRIFTYKLCQFLYGSFACQTDQA